MVEGDKGQKRERFRIEGREDMVAGEEWTGSGIPKVADYYHLRSTVKRECLFAKVYFSNVNGLVLYLLCLWRHTIMFCSRAVHVLKFFSARFDELILP